MSGFSMHQIKRAARKEAWYSDSYNPFGKTMRSSTWSNQPRDVESDGIGGEPVHTVQTEPTHSRDISDDAEDTIGRRSKEQEYHMTSGSGSGSGSTSNAKEREAESEETVVDRRSTRPPSHEEKARKRFVSRFFKKKGSKDEDLPNGDETEKPKKKPWYKGKELKHKPFTVRNQLAATLFNSWINILLLAAPIGIALNFAIGTEGTNGIIVFVVNFIAIIPLAGMLSFATEEVALHLGESLGGLLNASFGNAVELIVSVIALSKDEFIIVQTSLIGSILSNLLLVLGMSFFFGGLRRTEQFFNVTVAQTAASILALAVGSIIIPTCFAQFDNISATEDEADLAAISRGVSVILLVVYGSLLYFQLKSHSAMFAEESKKVPMRPRKKHIAPGAISKGLAKAGGIAAGTGRAQMDDRPPNDELINPAAYEEEPEEPEEQQLHIAVSWATLALSTAIVGVCADFMVDGIGAVTGPGKMSVEFVGLILLPIVGNAAEHATAVTVAIKDKMDLSIGVAIGSSMQISLLVVPLLVVLGWIMGKDGMNLSFDGFQVAVLFIAILLVNYLIGDGKSHWLEGMLLMALYIIIAICAWYYPQTDPLTGQAITTVG